MDGPHPTARPLCSVVGASWGGVEAAGAILGFKAPPSSVPQKLHASHGRGFSEQRGSRPGRGQECLSCPWCLHRCPWTTALPPQGPSRTAPTWAALGAALVPHWVFLLFAWGHRLSAVGGPQEQQVEGLREKRTGCWGRSCQGGPRLSPSVPVAAVPCKINSGNGPLSTNNPKSLGWGLPSSQLGPLLTRGVPTPWKARRPLAWTASGPPCCPVLVP